MKKITTLLFSTAAVLFMSLTSDRGGYDVGDHVADFSLKNVDQSMVALSDYKDHKGAIVIFTCNHCPYAQAYEDRIIALHNKYGDEYPVIAINPNDPAVYEEDSFENMQARAKEKEYPFVYLMDESQEVAKAFGASKTPHVYVLSRNSKKWSVEYIGAIDDNYKDAGKVEKPYVEHVIAELKNNKKPSKTTTKAIGCTIKWKK